MVQPFSQSALAHQRRLEQTERVPKILREYSGFAGYHVAFIWYAGEPILTLKPIPRALNADNLGLRRRDLSMYLQTTGDVDWDELRKDIGRWLRQMGKEDTESERKMIAKILETVWPDVYNPQPMRHEISEPDDPEAEVTIETSDGRKHTRMI